MGYKFNPFTGNFDTTDSPNGVFDSVEVDGDITLDDGGTYATTLQLITPTANRTISFPDATGTVALVGGSSGQLVYNNAGAYAGAPSTSVGATGNITLSLAGAASTPPVSLTGTWFTGGTATTTKPQVLIEPTGTTSTAWSTSGTGLGVNAASGFGGNLLDLQVNGSKKVLVDSSGNVGIGASSVADIANRSQLVIGGGSTAGLIDLAYEATSSEGRIFVNNGELVIRASQADGALVLQTSGSNERIRVKPSGIVNFSNTPVYADNTAALAGGLVAGDVYRKSDGTLMITY